MVLSCMMEIDWLNDEIQLVYPGPMIENSQGLTPSPDWDGLGPESV